MGEDLVLEKVFIEDDCDGKTDHLYTLSLALLYERVVLVVRSFTKKEEGESSMEVLFL